MQGLAGLAASIVLFRLLGPLLYGQYATAGAIIDVAGIALSWGFGVAVVQHRLGSEIANQAILGTAITLSLCAGVAFVSLSTIGAVVAIRYLPEGVAPLLPALALRAALTLLNSTLGAALQRSLRFGALAFASAVSIVACELVAVGAAFAGLGVWSLVARDLVATFGTGALIVIVGGLSARPAWNQHVARTMLRTGGGVLTIRGVETLLQRLDRLLVSRVGGTTMVGLYAEAAGLAGDSERALGPVLAQVGLGAYRMLREQPQQARAAFSLVQNVVVRFGCLIMLPLLAAPSELLGLFYGERRLAAAPFLRLLAPLALSFPIFEHIRGMLYAIGAVGTVVRIRLVQLVFFLPALALGVILWGAPGVAVAADLVVVIGILGLAISIRPYVGSPGRQALLVWWPVFLACVVSLVVGAFDGPVIHVITMSFSQRAGLFVTRVLSSASLERGTINALHVILPAVAYLLVLLATERARLLGDARTIWKALAGTRPNLGAANG